MDNSQLWRDVQEKAEENNVIKATDDFLAVHEQFCGKRKSEILEAPDEVRITGRTYYVSNGGDDANDGLSPESPWKTLEKVSGAELCIGDGVRFNRGDLFRGQVLTRPGVTYAAYGSGEKPKFYGWDKSLADEALWELYDREHHIWHLTESILDCGSLVFNDGEFHSRKLIPSYKNAGFVCRDDESRPFNMAVEMSRDLDMVCLYDGRLTTQPSKGEAFPIPIMDGQSLGDLYLRCDRGNPAAVFRSIEAMPRRRMFVVGGNPDVTIDNICIKYTGEHAIAGGGGCLKGLHVSNCEIGWIGGSIQHYFGTDPNYPQGGRGTVTRFGNGVEIYGGCDGYTVENCYIYQVYDAAMTHQISTGGGFFQLKNIRYADNLVEYCVYSIEYFLEKNQGDTESFIDGCEICGNILRYAGYGWGQQRHNTDTPAHIKGWSYENTAANFSIHGNIFDRAAYRMIHLVAKKQGSCPGMESNTYIQRLGLPLGQYGANEVQEPMNMVFDERAEEMLRTVVGEKNPTVYFL